MARFSIISKDGDKIRYEGKPRYIGTYLKPSYLEFSEIASPTPIDWQVGDYVDYPRTGMRYRLYSIPQASKNARKGSHGRAFTYSNVQLHAATKELEIALFKDLVSADNNIHFSTSPDVATFENVYGIARRIQACMDDLYPDRWLIQVADFDASEDAEILEKIDTAKDFALSGGTCLDALTKIYELWQEVGWIHTYDSASGKDVITIGYANKRIGANTTEPYIYGKGNGLTAIKKTQANKDEFATRLYVYGSDRNLPSRYYNNKNILNAESLDIRNLMLPIAEWGKTGNSPDARKAYLENAEAVAKYGVIPKTHYFDSDDAGADIYPTIEGITIGQVRRLQADYKPSTSIYPDDEERIDKIKEVVETPRDNGVINRGGNTYQYSSNVHIPASYELKKVPKVAGIFELTTTHVLYQSVIDTDFYHGEVVFQPTLQCIVPDASFTSVTARVTLGSEVESDAFLIRSHKTITIAAQKNDYGNWVIDFKDMSVKYDGGEDGHIYDNGFPINFYVTITVEKEATESEQEIQIEIGGGSAFLGIKEILDKTFILRIKQIGFDINERANLGSGKSISMKTGDCQGRNFVISSCVYIPWLDSWDLTLLRQQDDSLGMLFPNTNDSIKPGDSFVLLDIAMPELYVEAAMDRLLSEGEKFLSRVSRIRNNYEPSIDAKVMIETGRTIREGMFMQIADEDVVDGNTEYILIDTVNIYEEEAAIPTYKVTLKEKKKVSYKGTPSSTSVSNTKSVEEATEVDIDLSNYVTKEQFKSVENLKDFFYKTEDGKSIGTRYNLFSEKEVSAKGLAVGEASGSGIIKNVLGLSSLGSVESNDNTTTFNAYAIDSIYKKVVELEDKDVEVDLSDYYTKLQTDVAIATALEPYAKTEELDGKYAPLGEHNTIKTKVETLDVDVKAIEGNLSAIGKKVDTLDGSISTLNGRVNALDKKVADYDTFKQSTSTSIENLGKKDEAIASDIEGLSLQISNIKEGVNKVLGWFDVDENNNLFTTFNFYSTEEISANGFNASSGEGGGGLITTVLGASSFGSVSSNDNTTTFNAYAIDSLYKRIIKLEDKDVEVDLSDYYTKGQTQSAINTALVPYLKSADADGKYAPLAGFNTLKSDFDALNKALNDDVSGKVNTWNEIVDFLDEYSGSESLAVILERMNADIASRLLVSDFNSFRADDYNVFKSATNTAISALQKADESASSAIGSLQATVSGHTTQISGLTTRVSTAEGNISTNAKGIADNKAAIATNKGNISSNATAITYLGKRVTANEGNIAEILKWFAVDDDNNLYTTYNFYSTKEISGKGLSQGTGGGSSYVRLDSWDKYDASAGAVLSATLGYGLKTSVDGHASRIGVLESQVGQLATQSTRVSVSNLLTTGTRIATITVDGTAYDINSPNVDLSGYQTRISDSNKIPYSYISGTPTTDAIKIALIGSASFITSANIGSQSVASLIQEKVTDLNDVKKGTFFQSSLNASNLPSGANRYVTGIALATDNNSIYRVMLGMDYDGSIFSRAEQRGKWSAWKTIAFTDSNVASAQTLKHSNGKVGAMVGGLGELCLGSKGIWSDDGAKSLFEYSDNTLWIGYSTRNDGTTRLYGSLFEICTGNSCRLLINTSGNVTIGGSDLASTTTKLYVDGGIRFAPRTIWGQSFDGARNVSGDLFLGENVIRGVNNLSIFEATNTNITFGYGYRNLNTIIYGGTTKFFENSNVRMVVDSSGVEVTGGLKVKKTGGVEYITITAGDISVNYKGYDSDGFVLHRFYSNDTLLLTLNGNTNIATFTGNIVASGEISANVLNQGSDIRFKDRIEDVALSLDKITNAPVFRFRWNDRKDDRVYVGTSAQYWKEHIAELVSVNGEGFHKLDYSTLGVIIGVTLGRVVKNHEERISEIERRLKYEYK